MTGSPLIDAADVADILSRAQYTFQALRGARLFVTGCTGFFGRWLLAALEAANLEQGAGIEVVALSRAPERFLATAPSLENARWLQFCRGDARDYVAPEGAFSHFVHGATSTVNAAGPAAAAELADVITAGTAHVLEHAMRAKPQQLLYVSSGAVYGDQPSDLARVPEHFAGQPDPSRIESTYGLGKRAAERLCLDAAEGGGPPPVLARCFAFAGPHLPLDAHFAFGNFLRDGLAGRPISVAGDGAAVRSYLYGTDLAEWLLTLLVRGEARGAYNVGSDEPVSIADLAAAVGDHFGVPVSIARAADPGAPRRRYVPNTSRAQSLGLRANVSLPEAIARSAAFHRARGL